MRNGKVFGLLVTTGFVLSSWMEWQPAPLSAGPAHRPLLLASTASDPRLTTDKYTGASMTGPVGNPGIDFGSYHHVYVDSPTEKVFTVPSQDGRIHISAIARGASRQAIRGYLANSPERIVDKDLFLHTGSPTYTCGYTFNNGFASVDGVCVDALVISLPDATTTQVLVNQKILAQKGIPTPIELTELLSKAGFDDKRESLIRAFLISHAPEGRFLTTFETRSILSTFTWQENRNQVLSMLQSSIFDPENIDVLLAEIDSEVHKVALVEDQLYTLDYVR